MRSNRPVSSTRPTCPKAPTHGERPNQAGISNRPSNAAAVPERAIITYPFLTVDSIAPEVDSDPRAHYFQQISNGLFIRMALLQMILSK